MYNYITLLYTWNQHNIVDQVHSNINFFNHKKDLLYITGNYSQ